jgi:hypothetical protein
MTITYQTTINALYTVPNPTGYVVNCLFTVSGTDNTHTASIDGNISFTPEQNQPDFIPYDQLTQAEVMGWITESGQLPNLEACVEGQINSQINPPVSPSNTPLPWVTPVAPAQA